MHISKTRWRVRRDREKGGEIMGYAVERVAISDPRIYWVCLSHIHNAERITWCQKWDPVTNNAQLTGNATECFQGPTTWHKRR